jgi:hypothetical protein
MTNNNEFSNNFTPKTPKEVLKEKELAERKVKRAEQKALLEAQKPLKMLTEDLKKATDKFFNIRYDDKPKNFVKFDSPIEPQSLIEQLELDEPLVLKNGKITLDPQKLSDLISSQTAALVQSTVEKLNSANIPTGGGAVGIKYRDDLGNLTKYTRSVSDIIFTGAGVTLSREGKNIEINIAGAIAGDPTIDFARESTMLEIYSNFQELYGLVQDITDLIIPSSYSDGIGGSATEWSSELGSGL